MAAPFVGFKQDLVGQHVQLLLHFALDVFAFQAAQDAAQGALADRMADGLAGARDHFDQQSHFRRQGLGGALLLHQVLSECFTFQEGLLCCEF
ncbi:hypothetical protein D3C77_655170 [compost metagenome]